MKGNQKYTVDMVRKFFEGEGCIPLFTSYKNPKEKLEYIATCGHKHSMDFSNFKVGKGRKCSKCIGKNWTIDDIKDYFAKNGCKVLDDDYVVGRKIHYIATCEHEHHVTLHDFKEGKCRVCLKCSGRKAYEYDEVKQYFEDNGCKLLSIEYNGLQHYQFSSIFHRTEQGFQEQLNRDAAKRKYCKDAGIKLIEIDGRVHTK